MKAMNKRRIKKPFQIPPSRYISFQYQVNIIPEISKILPSYCLSSSVSFSHMSSHKILIEDK